MNIDYNHLKEIKLTPNSILEFIEAIENDELVNIKTFMIFNNNKSVVSFAKKPYKIKDKHLLFSITKSITGIGIGIAVNQGLLKLSDKMISFFPDKKIKNMSNNLKLITIENLLTMTSGIHDNTYESIVIEKDWISAFLNQNFSHLPGTYFRYTTHGSHILSAIIQKVSGVKLSDFVNENLFKPLEINSYQWEVTDDGISTGGMGLSLDTESLCKIAELILNKGVHKNKKILSKEFIFNATKAQIFKETEVDIDNKIYSGQFYGYHIHIGKDNYFRFDGAFGQVCLCIPDKNIVIAVTSQYSKLENLLKHIFDNIIDNIGNLEINNKNRLISKIESLNYISNFKKITNDKYKNLNISFDVNLEHNDIKNIVLKKSNNTIELLTRHKDKDSLINFDLNKIKNKSSCFIKDINWFNQKYTSYCTWDGDMLLLKVYYIETPYLVTYKKKSINNIWVLEYFINKSFTQRNFKVKGELYE